MNKSDAGNSNKQQAPSPQVAEHGAVPSEAIQQQAQPRALSARREQPCPQCGHPMSDLKGGHEAICPNCGFKDSCCY